MRFAAGGGDRWSKPVSSDPSVVKVQSVVRCGGSVLGEFRGLAIGSAQLHATMTTVDPTFSWQVRAVVTGRSARRATTPPPESRMLRGGGLLVYPTHLYDAGAEVDFTVPQVSCQSGSSERISIGLFGIKRFIPPTGRISIAAWAAGLTIRCPMNGHASYAVGYNHGSQLGTVQPGDRVQVSSSGPPCASIGITVSSLHGNTGRGYDGPGCRAGEHYEIRVQTLPTMLFGAELHGQSAARFELNLRSAAINGQPYRMAPHQLRAQVLDGRPVVQAHRSRDWYKILLSVG